MIETAYAQYKAGKHDDAVSSIDRFIRTYPTNRNIAYLYYLRGLSNSNRDTASCEGLVAGPEPPRPVHPRRPTTTSISLPSATRTAATPPTRERMIVLRNVFAQHELDVALYYMRRQAYVSAVSRHLHPGNLPAEPVPVRRRGHAGRGLRQARQQDVVRRCAPRAGTERPAART
jgi:outer membrane protein assembly factor BamD